MRDDPQLARRVDRDPLRRAQMGPDLEQLSVRVEDLDPVVLAVAHVEPPLPVDLDVVRRVELAWLRTLLAPRLHERPIAPEPHHSRVAVAIGNVEVAIRMKRDVRRPEEQLLGFAGLPRRSQRHLQLARPRPLPDRVISVVDRPHVALRIDPDPVRITHLSPSPRAHILALRVEHDHRIRDLAAMKHVDQAVGIHRHRRHASELPAGLDRRQIVRLLAKPDLHAVLEQAALMIVPAGGLTRGRRRDHE